jgi:hypothetical protein
MQSLNTLMLDTVRERAFPSEVARRLPQPHYISQPVGSKPILVPTAGSTFSKADAEPPSESSSSQLLGVGWSGDAEIQKGTDHFEKRAGAFYPVIKRRALSAIASAACVYQPLQ